MSTDLTIREDQTFWDNRQIAALQQLGVERATKTLLLDRMGTARHATYAGERIARRQPGRGDSINLIQTAKEV